MSRISVYTSQMPEGAERYGVNPSLEAAALVPSYMSVAGSEPASPSGIPYGVVNACMAMTKAGTACTSPKANGSDLCLGHQRQLNKMQRDEEEAKVEKIED